ncbi:MAG: TetR/AcrR family transcriptional regulator [Clostridia bacterium]
MLQYFGGKKLNEPVENLTKRKQQAQQTRRVLFENAIALFREKGLDAVTVEEITQRAGTAKGSFYTYFRTKSDIIIEEFRNIDEYYRKYHDKLKRYPDARSRIIAFTRAQLRQVRDDVGIAMLKILYSTNIMDPHADKILINPDRYLHSLVKEIVVEGQASGEFRTDLPADELALLFNRSMRSVFLDWAISGDEWDLVAVGMKYCETMLMPAMTWGTSVVAGSTRE